LVVARTITVTDDELGMTAVVRVDGTTGGFTVREVTYQAVNGGGLVVAELPMLGQLGMVLAGGPDQVSGPDSAAGPDVKQSVKSVAKPAGRAAVKPAAGRAKSAGKGKPVAGRPRQYRRSPDLADLRAKFAEHGKQSLVAQAYDVPTYTVAAWVRRFRDAGHDLQTSPKSAG
jgi:hypothetical protein